MVCYRRPPSSPHIHSARTAQDGSRKRYSYTSIKTMLQSRKPLFLVSINHTISYWYTVTNRFWGVSRAEFRKVALRKKETKGKCFALDFLIIDCTQFSIFPFFLCIMTNTFLFVGTDLFKDLTRKFFDSPFNSVGFEQCSKTFLWFEIIFYIGVIVYTQGRISV